MMKTIPCPVSLILLSFILCFISPRFSAASGELNSTASNEIRQYGIHDNSLEAVRRTVKPRQTLSNILKGFSVPSGVIHRIAHKSSKVFDLKSMKAGNSYLVFTSSIGGEARFMIYEKNPVDFVVFKLQDPLDVYQGKKNVTTDVVVAGGVIEHSLWESIRASGCDISLIEHLSDIYSWSVNFQHLQPGDRFAVLYKRRIAAETPVGIEGISAARLTHRGRDFYAFHFRSESVEGYYDEQGWSLKKAFLKAPLKYTRITSGFNPGRLHPVLNYRRPHLGTDFAAPAGTPIMSVADGRVQESRYHGELGNHMTIRHNGVYSTQYIHLSRFAKGIRPGAEVRQGQVIGYVGSTGIATGPHLELRLWKNGEPVDILKEDLPESESLDGTDKAKFLAKVASLKKELDHLRNTHDGFVKLTRVENLQADL